MNLEEIITAAVEKRVHEIVSGLILRNTNIYSLEGSPVDKIVSEKIQEIAQEEVKKHEETIRTAIREALEKVPTSFEVSAYTKINLPARNPDYVS